jgi:CBS domain-containing protein
MPVRNVPTAAAGPLVRDAMLRAPDTLAPTVTVAEARRLLESPRLRLLLVSEGYEFRGAVPRELVTDDLDPGMTLGELVGAHRVTVAPDEDLDRALALLDQHDSERLPVVADDGRLVGLVCFNRGKGHFCVDAE